jgi:hypothetical protein
MLLKKGRQKLLMTPAFQNTENLSDYHYFTVSNVKLPIRKFLVGRQISTVYSAGFFWVLKLVMYFSPSLSRVDRFLLMLQVEVCFLCFRLVSRRCHNISTIHQLAPAPHRTGRAVFPHPALQTGSQNF